MASVCFGRFRLGGVMALLALGIIAATLLYNWRRSGRSFSSFIGLVIVRSYARLWHGCTFPAPAELPRQGVLADVGPHGQGVEVLAPHVDLHTGTSSPQ